MPGAGRQREFAGGGNVKRNRLRALASAVLRAIFRFLSRAYVAGPELRDAIGAFDRFAARGHAGTIGYFNDSGEPPRRIADLDLATLDALASGPHGRRDAYLSIKVPAMHYDAELVGEIARKARDTGIGMHFDSHEIEKADPTFASIEVALREEPPQVGCTLPGRWARSLTDVDRAVARSLRVRVVKGQWADPAQPDLDMRAGFLAVIDRLAGRARMVAIASHDPVVARTAVQRLRAAGTPCELELLFGLPMHAALAVARDEGVPVRVYVPFGVAWVPYALSQLRRRPGLLWWMVRDALAIYRRRTPG